MSTILDAVKRDPERASGGLGSVPDAFEEPDSGSDPPGRRGGGRRWLTLAIVVVATFGVGVLAQRATRTDDDTAVSGADVVAQAPAPKAAERRTAPAARGGPWPAPTPAKKPQARQGVEKKAPVARAQELAPVLLDLTPDSPGDGDAGPPKTVAEPARGKSAKQREREKAPAVPAAKAEPTQPSKAARAPATAPSKVVPPLAKPARKIAATGGAAAVGAAVVPTAKPAAPAAKAPIKATPGRLVPPVAKPAGKIVSTGVTAATGAAPGPVDGPAAKAVGAPAPPAPGPTAKPAAPAAKAPTEKPFQWHIPPGALAALNSASTDGKAVPGAGPAGDGPETLEVLVNPPEGAPGVDLMFIMWARIPRERMVSMRISGGRIAVAREGDIVEGMKVASIHADAVDLIWTGQTFRVHVDRF